MKKGLLSILAGALVLVGCQNYDDQFDSLETQINALASTVAGLSQVQSDLSSLAGTVSSLSSTVASLGTAIDTAVSNGLADITADIAALQSAVADVASSSDLTAISEAVADAQSDLEQLLANGSIFQNSITINSVATLDVYHKMGTGINIVNGSVDIDATSDMDMTKLQTVVDNILTTTQGFDYKAGTGVDTEITFNNLTGTMTLTLEQKGGYKAQKLASATVVTLKDASSVGIVDLRALASVTSLSDGSGAGTFQFDKATELHLTALPRYTGSLSLKVKKGGVIDMTAFKDVAADGTAAANTLTIDGPASMTIANLTGDKTGSTLTLNNVASATVNGYDGTITLGPGVETFSSDNVVAINIGTATALETFTAKGVLDPNATTADTAGPAIAFVSAHNDLVTANLTGVLGAVSFKSVPNVESITLNADLNAAALTVTGNDDLTSLVVTGSKIGNVTVESNTDLASLVLDHTSDLTTALTGTGVTVSIKGNTNMTSLKFSADDVDSLTVTGNTALTTIDFTGLADAGTSTTATVLIKENGLVATEAKDTYNASTAADLGSYTTASGMATLKTYLTAANKIPSASGVIVFFDEVGSATKQSTATGSYADTSTTINYASGSEIGAVVYNLDDSTPAKYQTQSWYIAGPTAANGGILPDPAGFDASGDAIGIDYPVSATTTLTYDADDRSTVDAFITSFNTTMDKDNFDLTLTANGQKEHTFLVTFRETNGNAGSWTKSGTIYATFGTTTMLISAASVSKATAVDDTSGDLALARALADGINDLASFTATSGGVAGYAYVVVGSAESDLLATDVTPLAKWSIPTSLSVSKTGGTTSWSANATNGETSYTLSIGKGVARYAGFILTAKNKTSGSNRTIEVEGTGGYFGNVSALSTASFYNDGNIDGKSTTTVDSEIGAYIRSYANSDAGTSATTATNRLAWL